LLSASSGTTIELVAAFGYVVQSTLVNCPCRVINAEGLQSSAVNITGAFTDTLKPHCLLTPQDYRIYSDLIREKNTNNTFLHRGILNGDKFRALIQSVM